MSDLIVNHAHRHSRTASLEERFIRSSGPGGQNVNKVSSAVQLRFDVRAFAQPDRDWRAALLRGRQLTTRRRADHHGAAISRAGEEPRRCARPAGGDPAPAAATPKPRRATKVPKASKRKRLEGKKHRAEIKRGRGQAGLTGRTLGPRQHVHHQIAHPVRVERLDQGADLARPQRRRRRLLGG